MSNYARSVNYETAEVTTAWKIGERILKRTVFFSRADNIGVVKISGSDLASLDFEFRLSQLPIPEGPDDDEEDQWHVDELISEVTHGAEGNKLFYSTIFKKQWENSLKGYRVAAKVLVSGGRADSEEDWVVVRDVDEILVLIAMKLSYPLPLEPVTLIERNTHRRYRDLLNAHKEIHSEMFNRFSLRLGGDKREDLTSEDLLASSSFGALNPELVNRLCEASRYALICSTGGLPPTLQGIWGGTWRPAWSSDFTLNGNVPPAIACGLNCNFQEVTQAYLDYMWSMFDDFKGNARDLSEQNTKVGSGLWSSRRIRYLAASSVDLRLVWVGFFLGFHHQSLCWTIVYPVDGFVRERVVAKEPRRYVSLRAGPKPALRVMN